MQRAVLTMLPLRSLKNKTQARRLAFRMLPPANYLVTTISPFIPGCNPQM